MKSPTVVQLVRERDLVPDAVIQGDVHVPGIEDRGEALADELDDGLEIELLHQRGADLVDHGEFGVPLLGLGEEALRLVEEAGVLERDAHARSKR